MATRGSLGGLARTTADVTTVLDASGRDLIMIETVGVGQDEVDIVRLADITIVILVPGMGDDVQTHQSRHHGDCRYFRDQQERPRWRRARGARNPHFAITGNARNDGWTPPIIKTVASQGVGIEELADAISDYEAYLQKENLALHKSVENWQERLIEMLRDAMLEKARAQWQMAAWLGWRRKWRSTNAIPIRWSRRSPRMWGNADGANRSSSASP